MNFSVDIDNILADAPKRCYAEIADDFDIPINTFKKIVRKHNHAILKRYKQDADLTKSKQGDYSND